jgi:hypothetical protein
VLLQVITDVVAAVIATVFAIVLLATTAQQITGIIHSNNACGSTGGCAVYYPVYTLITFFEIFEPEQCYSKTLSAGNANKSMLKVTWRKK